MVQSLDRALSVLEQVAARREGIGIGELSKLCALPPSTVHRLLATLVCRGYVRQDPATERYATGLKVLELASGALASQEIRRIALPFLTELKERTRETAHVMVLNGKSAVCVESVQGSWNTRTSSSVGGVDPLHCTAVGKVFMAHMPESVVLEMVGQGLLSYTPGTHTTAEALLPELAQTRNRGYAVDDEEYEVGVRCIAAPVFDARADVCAAVGISGLAARITDDRLREYAALVVDAAERITGICPHV